MLKKIVFFWMQFDFRKKETRKKLIQEEITVGRAARIYNFFRTEIFHDPANIWEIGNKYPIISWSSKEFLTESRKTLPGKFSYSTFISFIGTKAKRLVSLGFLITQFLVQQKAESFCWDFCSRLSLGIGLPKLLNPALLWERANSCWNFHSFWKLNSRNYFSSFLEEEAGSSCWKIHSFKELDSQNLFSSFLEKEAKMFSGISNLFGNWIPKTFSYNIFSRESGSSCRIVQSFWVLDSKNLFSSFLEEEARMFAGI